MDQTHKIYFDYKHQKRWQTLTFYIYQCLSRSFTTTTTAITATMVNTIPPATIPIIRGRLSDWRFGSVEAATSIPEPVNKIKLSLNVRK